MKKHKFLVIWITFHFLAMILSLFEVEGFTNAKPKSEKFWPFTKIVQEKLTEKFFYVNSDESNKPNKLTHERNEVESKTIRSYVYNGIFKDYDYSEFIVYIVLGWLFVYMKKRTD